MNTKARKESFTTEKEVQAVLAILPRGHENVKTGPELVDILRAKGFPNMTDRRLRAAIRQLRFEHGVVAVGIPGLGYWIATTEQGKDEGLAYFLRMASEHINTYTALKVNWVKKQLGTGAQMSLINSRGEAETTLPIQSPSSHISLGAALAIKRDNRPCGLSFDQVLTAIICYWELGMNFMEVAAELSRIYGEKIAKDRVIYFWHKLNLPNRPQGGWGRKNDPEKARMCTDEVKEWFGVKDEA